MSQIPRVADLLRDPAIRESYRRVRKMRPGRGRRPSIKSLVFHDVVQTGDVIGRGPDGEFFLLITVSQRSFAWLCSADAFDGREEDNVDQGEDELPAGMHTGAGDSDDAEQDDAPEEDDYAGGNVTDGPHDNDDPPEQDDDAGDFSGRRTPREEARLQAARERLELDQPPDLTPRPVTIFHEDGTEKEVLMGHLVPATLRPQVTA